MLTPHECARHTAQRHAEQELLAALDALPPTHAVTVLQRFTMLLRLTPQPARASGIQALQRLLARYEERERDAGSA